jgi:superfamily II DNA/RNA helicase
MSGSKKDQAEILNKLGIEQLNQMQVEAHTAISENDEIVLISPTGTGKTIAFLLPILNKLDVHAHQIQVLILVPSRELAIQIEQVAREMGSGYKINAVYGGKAGYKDRMDLKHPPHILIGTPGRIADHIRNQTIETTGIKTLILDEYDKSLETGFEKEMKEIISGLPPLNKMILTSATRKSVIPTFIKLKNPVYLTFENEEPNQLKIRIVASPPHQKLRNLKDLIGYLGNGRGIIFCNLKETLHQVNSYLLQQKISHATFYGGMEQQERERSLVKFRNHTHRLLLATDLAARGIDVPELDFIIHFELSFKKDEYIHRNGRTARMHQNGVAYLMLRENETIPGFVLNAQVVKLEPTNPAPQSKWETLYISGGRKDKISKGDIAGLFFKQGGLSNEELGSIELKQDCSYVAVHSSKTNKVIKKLNNSRLKKKKVRISILK